MEYKKTYKGLVLFFSILCLTLIGGAVLFGIYFPAHSSRYIICCISLCMAALTVVIHKTGYVYWYNNISFEEAEKAGEERRKKYSLAHMKLFGIFALCQIVLSVTLAILSVSQYVDFSLGCIGLCVIAIYTVKFKL